MAAKDNKRLAEAVANVARGDPPILLDGATGTELERRGVPAGLPLWSSHALLDAPEVVGEIHRDYVQAGCQWITANTFRTQRHVLEKSGLGHEDERLTGFAIELAAAARPGGGVLGSAPPLEDCYRPDLVPADSVLAKAHGRHCRLLAEAGADGIWVETHNTVREAVAASVAAAETGLPFLVSFVCDPAGRLLSGETLEDGLQAVAPLRPVAVGVNCLPPSAVDACLSSLRAAGPPWFVAANLGPPASEGSFERANSVDPESFAGLAEGWLETGATLVGGCCGTTPAHLAAVASALSRSLA